MSKVLFDHSAIDAALDAMARTISAPEVWMVGIQRGGAHVADAIQQRLQVAGVTVHRGNLDISFYRDDLDTIGPNPEVRPSELPFAINDRPVWLIDDVLFTGRTIRAAMDELFDYGRPASIRLAVLVDRSGRELPITADSTGFVHSAPAGSSVKLVAGEQWQIEHRQVK